MIAGDRDRIELRHLLRGVAEDVRDDPHRVRRRIDVGVAHHELFQNVVLNGAREFFRRHALFLGSHHEQRQDRQHGAVHGHRHAHLVERNAGEQRAHVVDGVDRDTGHADVAGHPRMIAVVTAMGGEVEGNRQALLPGREVAAIERVGIFRRGEAGVLAHRPGLVDVHGRVGAAQIGRDARPGVEEIDTFEIRFTIDRLHRNPLRRQPGRSDVARGCSGLRCEGDVGKIRDAGHGLTIVAQAACPRSADISVMIRMLVADDLSELFGSIVIDRRHARQGGDGRDPVEPGFCPELPGRNDHIRSVERPGHDLDLRSADRPKTEGRAAGRTEIALCNGRRAERRRRPACPGKSLMRDIGQGRERRAGRFLAHPAMADADAGRRRGQCEADGATLAAASQNGVRRRCHGQSINR